MTGISTWKIQSMPLLGLKEATSVNLNFLGSISSVTHWRIRKYEWHSGLVVDYRIATGVSSKL